MLTIKSAKRPAPRKVSMTRRQFATLSIKDSARSRRPTHTGLLASVALGTLLLTSAGCATLTRGRMQTVVVSSEPSGAVVSVDGVDRGTTPAVVSLRRKEPHTLEVGANGYVRETQRLLPHADYALVAVNLFLFHPAVAAIGVGVDLLTGAHNTLSPKAVSFRMVVSDTAAAGRGDATFVPWLPVPIGSRIRVSTTGSPSTTAIGTLLAISGDTLVLDSTVAAGSRRIPRQSVGTIDLSLGPNPVSGFARGAWRGALIGLGAGAAVGAITGGGAAGAYFIGLIYGVPAGAIVGAIAGASVPKNDKWVRVR